MVALKKEALPLEELTKMLFLSISPACTKIGCIFLIKKRTALLLCEHFPPSPVSARVQKGDAVFSCQKRSFAWEKPVFPGELPGGGGGGGAFQHHGEGHSGAGAQPIPGGYSPLRLLAFWGCLVVFFCFVFLIQVLANESKTLDETQNLERHMTLCMGSFLVRCSSMDCYVLKFLASMRRICVAY